MEFWLWFIILVLAVIFIRRVGQVQPAADEQSSVVVDSHPTDNPWLQRVFQSPAYGRVPSNCEKIFRRATANPEERVFAAVHTNHGYFSLGYLLATTHHVRWVQTFPRKTDDFWSYAVPLQLDGSLIGPTVLTLAGDQFQVRGFGHARRFHELHRYLTQALLWEEEQEAKAEAQTRIEAAAQAAVERPARTASGGTADELERLVALRESGALTGDEFQTAKSRLLGSGA